MVQKIVGIDIGSYSVKAVRLKSKMRGSYEFIDSFYEPIGFEGEDREQSIVDAIKRMVDENKLGDDIFIGAISADKVTSRFLHLPFSERRKLDKVIGFEVENHIPFSSDDISADYQLLKKGKDGADVFAQVVKKTDVIHATDILKKAGIVPKYLDSEVMTLFSAINESFDDNMTRAVLDIGHVKTIFTVVKDRKIAYSRSIDFGGAAINEMIVKELNVSEKVADEMKRTEEASGEVDDIIKRAFMDFSNTLSRDIVSFEMEYDEELPVLLLTGGMSDLNDIDETLGDFLGVRVNKLSLSDMLPKATKGDIDSMSVIAYGIALRSKNSNALSTIDFKTDKGESSDELKFVFKSMVKVFVMALILITFYGVDLYINKRAREEALKSLENKIKISFNEALPNEASRGNELAIIKEKIKEAQHRAEKVGGVLSKGVTTLDMLNELSVMIKKAGKDEDVEIYECSFDGKRLNILGETKSYNLTDEIKKGLETSDMFKEVKMEYAKFTADQKKVKFSMKIALSNKVEK